MATKLTTKAIKAFHYEGDGKSRDVRWDSELPSFGLRIYPSGKKAFVIFYRAKGRSRLYSLGAFGKLTLQEARDEAGHLFRLIRKGIDPVEAKRTAGQGKTFGDLIDDFMSRHVRAQRLKTEKAIERRLERNIPRSWKSRLADSITTVDVGTLHTRIGRDRPYEANRLLEILRAMYNQAPAWGYIPKGADNPAAGIKRFREVKRARFAEPHEVAALVWGIDQEPNVYARAALVLYLLTGARRSELLAARRRDIDWQTGTLHLPDTKSGEPQSIALSGAAQAILRALPVTSGNPYIFPGEKERAHLVNVDRLWQRVRQRATVRLWAISQDKRLSALIGHLTQILDRTPTYAEACAAAGDVVDLPTGLMDLRLHDLRRTVGSWLSQSGVDLNVVKSALRHADLATTLVYARLGADPARAALERHGERVMEIIGPPRLVEGGDVE
jgi:integrase